MTKSPNSLDHSDRLSALALTQTLDALPEACFDRITAMAARLLRSQTCLISLVTPDRQFFLSASGLGEPYATSRETPLSHSFCRHVVESREPLVVPDARQMLLVAMNAAVVDLNVISYLGSPIVVHEQVLGALCVINDHPRDWTKDDVRTASEFAQIVADKIALREVAIKATGLAQENATLAREYHHRVKNTLAVSAALVTLSARDAESIADLASKARGRLTALASAHDALMLSSDHVDFEALTKRLLQPYVAANSTVTVSGPSAFLRQHQITPICLILHELATNSTKHGVFGSQGTVVVSWKALGSEQLFLRWDEHLGDLPDRVTADGFGSVLLNLAAKQLGGTCQTVWNDHGLIVTLVFPHLAETTNQF